MAFKLGYCTLRWREPDLVPALEELKKAGWEGWEGRFDQDWIGPPEHLKKVCDDAGMPLAVYTAHGSPDSRDWAHVERNRRRMDFAAAMGVDCFMFMNGPKPENGKVIADDIKRAAAGADEWAEYAEQYGLELSYHIHTNLLVDSRDDWKLYMNCLEKAKLCIDVSHAELWGYDPVEAIEDFWDQLNYIHLQDYTTCAVREPGQYNPNWVPVGEAECLDFGAVLDKLQEKGFDRWVTACPGQPPKEGYSVIEDARRSARMRQYVQGLGY